MPNKYFSAAAFAHRHNLDGTWDSICTECFLTVASAWDETELLDHERGHDCNSLMRARHIGAGIPLPSRRTGPLLDRHLTSAYVEAEDEPS